MPPRFEIDYPSKAPTARGAFWLGVISLFVGLSLVAPPLSVLYETNDECRRTGVGGAEHGVWETLYRTPPLSVDRSVYAAVRMTCLAGALNALVLAGVGVVTIRSRELGIRLLGVNAVAHVVVMVAMIWAGARFAAALDAATAQNAWTKGQPFGSAVKATAVWAALPGMAYPLVLFSLMLRHGKSRNRRFRLG
jgi:hypothetical protein